jgi:hypothetical protein
MRRTYWIGSIAVGVALVGALVMVSTSEVRAQKGKVDPTWDYKVSVLTYNPGERFNDDQRASQFEKILNDQARQGWEPVGSLLSRNTVQTVGGGVTTRETTSFLAFRRPKR